MVLLVTGGACSKARKGMDIKVRMPKKSLVLDRLGKVDSWSSCFKGEALFDSEELHFDIDEKVSQSVVTLSDRKDANKLIEEFMLLLIRQ